MIPRFIVFESIDGAGKSTQARLLAMSFGTRPGPTDLHPPAVCARLTREPSSPHLADEDGDPLAYSVTDPHAKALLFAADRRLHQPFIEENLRAGIHVVCDRYSLSMQAYQSASGCDLDWLIALDRGCRVPDLTIYLNIPVADAMARLDGKPGANHDAERLREVSRCYGAAIALAHARGERIEVIDATGTPDEVHARILAVVRSGA